jgi:carboxyl-terminal processing protease
MSLKIRAILVVVIGVVMGVSLSIGGGLLSTDRPLSQHELSQEQAQLFAEVYDRVKREYVEPVDDAELLESAIRGMVSDLDPHSEFLDADEYREIRSSSLGSYTGIGIEVAEIGGAIHVISPIAGSPAARAGIRSGDELVAVNGKAIDASRLRNAMSLLRGTVGTKVTLSMLRDETLIDYEMRRQIIKVASVHKESLSPSYGYARINQFSDNTARELSEAIDDLQDAHGEMLEGVVLDLRNNPGGVLDAAVDVSDLFLDAGVIVTADGRSLDSRFTRSAHRGDILNGLPLVVLVNSGSASASEIVAGALQDHNRATIVGTNTFGKGLVQTVMPLSKGRAIKLTTSRYFTPSGDSIHEVGVTPDIVIEETPGHPDLSLSGVLDSEADAQLSEALQQLQSRAVMHSNAQ